MNTRGGVMRSLVLLLALPALAQEPGVLPGPPDPHHHLVPVQARPWTTELAPDARFRAVTDRPGGRDTVLSPDGRWRAFVVESSAEPGGRIRLEQVNRRTRFELQGVPLPYRPLSDLAWLDSTLLAFDRWSQPHHGLHYVVDVKRRRLVLAAPFPDQFYVRQHGGPVGGPP